MCPICYFHFNGMKKPKRKNEKISNKNQNKVSLRSAKFAYSNPRILASLDVTSLLSYWGYWESITSTFHWLIFLYINNTYKNETHKT